MTRPGVPTFEPAPQTWSEQSCSQRQLARFRGSLAVGSRKFSRSCGQPHFHRLPDGFTRSVEDSIGLSRNVPVRVAWTNLSIQTNALPAEEELGGGKRARRRVAIPRQTSFEAPSRKNWLTVRMPMRELTPRLPDPDGAPAGLHTTIRPVTQAVWRFTEPTSAPRRRRPRTPTRGWNRLG